MTTVNSNSNIWKMIQNKATDGGTFSFKTENISASEGEEIMREIAKDGKVSADEEAAMKFLLEIVDKKSTNKINGTPISPKQIEFDVSSLRGLKAGDRVGYEENSDKLVELPSYIDKQTKGAATDYKFGKAYKSKAVAKAKFKTARRNLMDVNNWKTLMTSKSTTAYASPNFSAHDASGKPIKTPPANPQDLVGKYIKIDAPGPADSPMWVKVTKVVDNPGEFNIQVQPAPEPGVKHKPNMKGKIPTDHMYTSDARNNFRLTLEGNSVKMGYHGRNEVVNYDHDGHVPLYGATETSARDAENAAVDTAMANGGRYQSWKWHSDGIIP